ncbi:uncharacterized protein DUF2680 [Anaerobacterium chartisolvens]|uniref:Uncharacterized protein DUF2680 n=1 Tax=Anaerobacterium chartisolvens TaxID=1297424 RepID=A0A369BDL1_9FIRM|nr:DUF2680 domain-containing protein [Anaerobacterium chartisolvens]RCX19315.1 uncharacterized protein DUF2680 [Anaerobacterium chartisolvens]
MKIKTLVVLTAIVAAVVIPFSAFAAASDSSSGKKERAAAVELTEQQKSDMEEFSAKLASLRKEYIAKMVSNGSMTQEQADKAIEKIDKMLESGKCFMPPGIMGMGGKGFGRVANRGDASFLSGINLSALTDEQKSAVTKASEKIASLQKEFIDKMISQGLITEEQGSTVLKRAEAASQDTDSSDKKGFGIRGPGGLNLSGIEHIDASKLTDAQKELLTSFYTRLSDIQKELVNTMVSNGAITAEQGKTCIQNIDERLKSIEENGFKALKDIRKPHIEGRRNNAPGKPNAGNSAN